MAYFELSLNGEEYLNISPDPDPGHLILEGEKSSQSEQVLELRLRTDRHTD